MSASSTTFSQRKASRPLPTPRAEVQVRSSEGAASSAQNDVYVVTTDQASPDPLTEVELDQQPPVRQASRSTTLSSAHRVGSIPDDIIIPAHHQNGDPESAYSSDTPTYMAIPTGDVSVNTPQADPPPPRRKEMSILRMRVWIAFCVVFITFAPAISIYLGFTKHTKDMTYATNSVPPDSENRTVG